eukprot:gnl/Dysnectes_brevis/8008_a13948_271.p1 GENE.gnl/Dysnectes_brevis/8008_a13948_271~~gnl/Dysnectes_brevis/8008_a13948_271.p1  ORF type:complete len:263 (-),score=12.39 gnl/Dysnectes_brevis/8008_a13948_271:154-942(-)
MSAVIIFSGYLAVSTYFIPNIMPSVTDISAICNPMGCIQYISEKTLEVVVGTVAVFGARCVHVAVISKRLEPPTRPVRTALKWLLIPMTCLITLTVIMARLNVFGKSPYSNWCYFANETVTIRDRDFHTYSLFTYSPMYVAIAVTIVSAAYILFLMYTRQKSTYTTKLTVKVRKAVWTTSLAMSAFQLIYYIPVYVYHYLVDGGDRKLSSLVNGLFSMWFTFTAPLYTLAFLWRPSVIRRCRESTRTRMRCTLRGAHSPRAV